MAEADAFRMTPEKLAVRVIFPDFQLNFPENLPSLVNAKDHPGVLAKTPLVNPSDLGIRESMKVSCGDKVKA